jgi:mono/diheme cytochrome c family protein
MSGRLPLLLTMALSAFAQSSPDKIWDGVFTEAQAARGKEAFLMSCSNCHGLDAIGTVRAPSLKGEKFMLDWQNGSVNNLFTKIRDSMPATYPETVADNVKLDIITYLLQVNSFPAGASELRLNKAELESIQIVQKGRRAGVPNFTLVQMVGCLERGPGQAWALTKTSEPAVIKEDTPSPAAIADAATQALGTQTFLLVSAGAFTPEAHAGHKMEARGLLYRDGSENRLNLTSLQMAASACNL